MICPYCKEDLNEVFLQVNLEKQLSIISGKCPKCGTVEFVQAGLVLLIESHDLNFDQLRSGFKDAIIRTKH